MDAAREALHGRKRDAALSGLDVLEHTVDQFTTRVLPQLRILMARANEALLAVEAARAPDSKLGRKLADLFVDKDTRARKHIQETKKRAAITQRYQHREQEIFEAVSRERVSLVIRLTLNFARYLYARLVEEAGPNWEHDIAAKIAAKIATAPRAVTFAGEGAAAMPRLLLRPHPPT